MKAVVCSKYGLPEVLQVKEIETPTPKANEIRVKIYATCVTASDCIIRGFKISMKFWIPMWLAIGFRKPRQPILGMVFAGEIDSVGKDVKQFKEGDQVVGFDRFGFGTYAEYKCMPEKGLVIKKAACLDYQEAVAIPFGGLMAGYYLRKANIQTGQKILVYGASGAIGTSAVQLAKSYGAEVTGVCSSSNLELVKSIGADYVIDYTKENFMLSGNRYDLIFNAVGKNKIQLQCKKALTEKGKHITVDDGSPTFQTEDLILLNNLIETGQLKAVIDRCYPLEQIVDAHKYVDKGHKKGNVIISIAQDN